jgi:hypothetical protein
VGVRLAPTPAILYRIGRAPDPLAFPPLAYAGSGRYDDPLRRRATLYAAIERRAAFMETLDVFRPDLAALAARDEQIRAQGGPTQSFEPTSIPARYFQRHLVRFGVADGQQWLDVRSPETHVTLRNELGAAISRLGIGTRFVLGDLIANDHRLTRLVAGWAIDRGFHGVAYASCHDPALTCWAIFEGTQLISRDAGTKIDSADPDLLAVAALWNLAVPAVSSPVDRS